MEVETVSELGEEEEEEQFFLGSTDEQAKVKIEPLDSIQEMGQALTRCAAT